MLTAGLALPLLALNPGKSLTQYAHRVWGQEEGLFQPTIYSILQTKDGFLWLGTQDSLIRFDGMHFREFKDGASVLHGSLIRTLLEDRKGNLWAGSIGSGLARISREDQVTQFSTRNGLPNDSVFCLASGRGNDIWACTYGGLVHFGEHGLRVFTARDGLPSNHIRAACEANDGTVWVAGIDFSLARLVGSRFVPYANSQIPSDMNITGLDCAADGSIWAGHASGVTQILATGARTLTTRDGLPDDDVSALAEGPEGTVWIGTNSGISRYQHGEISVYRTRDGLSHSQVLALYLDHEGSLWAGTKDGLDQFTDGKVTPYTTNEGLLSNDVGPVLEDNTNRLWIGTLHRGLNSFDGRSFRSVTTSNGLSDNSVLSLALDPSGDLWVGTHNGLDRIRNGRVFASYGSKDGLSGTEIRSLFVDEHRKLWVGSDRGLDGFNGSRFFKSKIVPHDDNTVVTLGGSRSVPLFVSLDRPALYLLRDNISSLLPVDISHAVDCYFIDHVLHATWMGTLGSGLLRWKNGAMFHVHVKDGLYDNRIYSILSDGKSNLWLASSKGIFRVSQSELNDLADGRRKTLDSIPFSTGQLHFECQSGVQPAAWRTHDGRLWFSTTSGLVVVDPNHLHNNQVPPPVSITSMIVNGRRVNPRTDLQLKPWETNNVEIRYAGLSFISPEKVTFRYLLHGHDKTWVDAGDRREAFFTNLPHGHYRFEVQARSADAVWSSISASSAFTVLPRVYQRWWFFPLLCLALGLTAFAGYRVRIRRLKHGFDLVLAERTRIARELHDTLLQGLSGITMQLQALWTKLPASGVKHQLAEIIGDAGRCSSEARRSLWGLRNTEELSQQFSDKLAAGARQAVTGRGLVLTLQIVPVSLADYPDVEYQLLRIALEAVTNSLKHANAGCLKVSLHRDGPHLTLSVEDDGVGFTDVAHQAWGHFGLQGMQERANQIGAELSIITSLNAGTKIVVSLKLDRSFAAESNLKTVSQHQLQ